MRSGRGRQGVVYALLVEALWALQASRGVVQRVHARGCDKGYTREV
jgi:hypothetical protein